MNIPFPALVSSKQKLSIHNDCEMNKLKRKLRKTPPECTHFLKHKKYLRKYSIRPGKYLKVAVKKGYFCLQQLLVKATKMIA